MGTKVVAGIDFGGGLSKVTVSRDGKLIVVPDASGNEVFLTAVFKDPNTGELLYSYDAQNAGIASADDLAMDFKRNIANPKKLYFRGTATGKDVAVMLAKHMAARGSQAAGETVTDCCATRPVAWGDIETATLLDVFKQAGLKPIVAGDGGSGVLTEPSAGALAYIDSKNLRASDITAVVVDIGSTTTDIVIIKSDRGVMVVLGVFGDSNLGGFNIQNDLCDLVLNQARKDGILKPADLAKVKTTSEHRISLLKSIEEAMKALCHRPETRVPISFGHKPGIVKVTRAQYESEVLEKYVERVCAGISKALANAIENGHSAADEKLSYLIPIGGPNRNPYVLDRLSKHVGLPAKTDVDALRAIVTGAAKHASWLMEQRGAPGGYLPNKNRIRPVECVPHDIAVMTMETIDAPWKSLVLIKKGQTVPATATAHLTLLEDHQTGVICPFVQCDGSGRLEAECHPLEKVDLQNLPLEPVRTARIQVTASFDEATLVRIEVVDLISGQRKQIQLATIRDDSPRTAA